MAVRGEAGSIPTKTMIMVVVGCGLCQVMARIGKKIRKKLGRPRTAEFFFRRRRNVMTFTGNQGKSYRELSQVQPQAKISRGNLFWRI